jgi:hypothetical protein
MATLTIFLVQDLEKEISHLQREVEMLQLRKPRMKIQDIIQDNDKVKVYITIFNMLLSCTSKEKYQ